MKTMTLTTAINKEDGSVIDKLEMKEPTAGDLDFAESNSKTMNGRTITIISRVSGVNEKYIRMLGARDYSAAAKYLESFLEEPLTAGAS